MALVAALSAAIVVQVAKINAAIRMRGHARYMAVTRMGSTVAVLIRFEGTHGQPCTYALLHLKARPYVHTRTHFSLTHIC